MTGRRIYSAVIYLQSFQPTKLNIILYLFFLFDIFKKFSF